MKVGIYTRISADREETKLGVKRQFEDCAKFAERKGWEVAEHFEDNDVSATRSKVRPAYQRMLAAVREGRIAGIIVWDVDRLTRSPRELEDIIDLVDTYKVSLANVAGRDDVVDLSTANGRFTARVMGALARAETDKTSRRIRRAFEQKAAAGEPHGFVPFGFVRQRVERDGVMTVRDLPDPETAPLIRDAARRILAGESLRRIAADWNDAEVATPRGGPWNSTLVRQLLKRPTNAGIRTRNGKPVGSADPESAIYDEGTHARLEALFSSPDRNRFKHGSEVKHLLSGLVHCGLCGSTMRRLPGRMVTVKRTGGTKRQPAAYSCKECMKVRRNQEKVDALVVALVVARLQQPDVLAALSKGDPEAVERARTEIAELEARQEVAADTFASGDITAEQLKRITAALTPRIAAARATLAAAAPDETVSSLAGNDAAERWEAASLDVRRSVINALMTVTILPSGPGRGFNPEHIKIEWKGTR